jgi:hypothetical protein
LNSGLEKGLQYNTLAITDIDANVIPNQPGWLVLGFGESYQTGPIGVLGRYANVLQINGSFRMPFSIPSGAKATWLYQNHPWVSTGIGNAYITDSNSGRLMAEKLLKQVKASGVRLNLSTVFSSDRGLGAEGCPTHGADRLSDNVEIHASDDISKDVAAAREE